jgi:hypothetical protein
MRGLFLIYTDEEAPIFQKSAKNCIPSKGAHLKRIDHSRPISPILLLLLSMSVGLKIAELWSLIYMHTRIVNTTLIAKHKI